MVGKHGESSTILVGPRQAVINETPTDTDMGLSRVILQAPPGLFIFPGERLVSHRLLPTLRLPLGRSGCFGRVVCLLIKSVTPCWLLRACIPVHLVLG